MKLRYIFCFFLSVSFIFTSLNFYKGKSLDEKILIHDSGNDWYIMSLLEQDSRENIELGDTLYEEYDGIYCDKLGEFFREATGLETRVPRVCRINA